MKILVTGGAGFVGSNLCKRFKRDYPTAEVVAFDNLRRRGSEINLPEFKKLGIKFVHGDIRHLSDLRECGSGFDLMVEASAEPSVHAGQGGDTSYLFDTNLVGTYNALEFARASVGRLVFFSTSRVYSIEPLRSLKLTPGATRLEYDANQTCLGASAKGINEDFSTATARSFYGTTKLCSEQLIQEYIFTFGLDAVINRCGVIAGPGQFGKVDQGVFTLWVLNHHFGKQLSYTGFGGTGLQVRDLLHPEDLFALVKIQSQADKGLMGKTYNVGGGPGVGSVSLKELTALCETAVGRKIEITSDATTNPVDIPWFVCDNSRVSQAFGWQPQKTTKDIVTDIAGWVRDNEALLKALL